MKNNPEFSPQKEDKGAAKPELADAQIQETAKQVRSLAYKEKKLQISKEIEASKIQLSKLEKSLADLRRTVTRKSLLEDQRRLWKLESACRGLRSRVKHISLEPEIEKRANEAASLAESQFLASPLKEYERWIKKSEPIQTPGTYWAPTFQLEKDRRIYKSQEKPNLSVQEEEIGDDEVVDEEEKN